MDPVDFGPLSNGMVYAPTAAPHGFFLEGGTGDLTDGSPGGRISVQRVPLSVQPRPDAPAHHIHGVTVFISAGDPSHALAVINPDWGISVTASGVGRDDLAESVRSIPVIGSQELFGVAEEKPFAEEIDALTLQGWMEDSAAILTEGSSLVPGPLMAPHFHTVGMRAGPLGDRRYLTIAEADANPLARLAVIVSRGQLFRHGRLPVVASWDPEIPFANVMWVQRDRFFHLMAHTDPEDLSGLATRIMAKVDQAG